MTTTYSLKQIVEVSERVLKRARLLRARKRAPVMATDETRHFIEYWFPIEAQQQLAALAESIMNEPPGAARDFAWLVFSSSIIAKSAGASWAMDISRSRPHKRKHLLILNARSASDIDTAFAAMATKRVDGVLILRDALFATQAARIAALAVKGKLPTMHGFPAAAEAGVLLAYGTSTRDSFRRAATYVDKIFKGAKPADLPVEQPTKFDLVINLKTAKTIGLAIPQTMVLQTDKVIE